MKMGNCVLEDMILGIRWSRKTSSVYVEYACRVLVLDKTLDPHGEKLEMSSIGKSHFG